VSLPRKTKLGYGAAEPGVLAVETLARLHVLKFYTDVLGLRPELAGAAAAIAIVWDAFADLFIGLASDRTRSRFGRRRPFLLAGGLALAGSCVLLFHPPAATSELVKTAFLLGSFIALNTSVSLLSVPHTALASELTFDRDERTELFGYRLFLGNLGLLAGSTLPGLALAYAERGQITREAAYGLASWGVGGLVLVTAITSFAATSGRDRSPPDVGAIGPRVLLHSFRDVLGDRTFRPLLIAYLIAQIGLAINGTFALYYYEYRLRLSADDVARVLGVFVTAWSLSIPAWVMASRRWGKRWLAFSGITLLGVLTAWIYLVAPPGQLVLPMVIAVLGGAPRRIHRRPRGDRRRRRRRGRAAPPTQARGPLLRRLEDDGQDVARGGGRGLGSAARADRLRPQHRSEPGGGGAPRLGLRPWRWRLPHPGRARLPLHAAHRRGPPTRPAGPRAPVRTRRRSHRSVPDQSRANTSARGIVSPGAATVQPIRAARCASST
jgi:Na+/melibiose symporter-like transporter